MSHSSYRRVNRKRVCLICGKPDWCSFTPDEKISFCARITQNANRVSRTGWGVFYHENSFSDFQTLPCPDKPTTKKPELAPIEIRDFAYRKLIELAPATNSDEIINGLKGLRARKILDFENYGSLPQNQTERTAIARKIRLLINQNFPDYVRKQKSSISRVPGFWLDKCGKVRLWQAKDYIFPMLLIPYRNEDGLIEACQIRFMTDFALSLRYVWLSTPNKSGGLSSGSPLHFITLSPLDKPLIITEGALKAETVKALKPNLNIIANAGVSCSHEQIISFTRFYPVSLAFDKDSSENKHVARAVANLIALRLNDSRIYDYNFDLSVLCWDDAGVCGIDDALLQKMEIHKISAFDWFEKLAGEAKDEARSVLKQIF